MQLSSGQTAARDTIHRRLSAGDRVLSLTGPAGSGKTTLMKTISDDLAAAGRGVKMVAPTGKAAVRLREVSGHSSETIHRALYRHVQEDDKGNPVFGTPGPPCEPGDVLICDESSMVGVKMHRELRRNLPAGASLLYVGDPEQLRPVGDDPGPCFGPPTAHLHEVHRQALESPIIRLVTRVREEDPDWDWRRFDGWEDGRCELRRRQRPIHSARWLATERKAGAEATLITFMNKVRREINTRTRRSLGRGADPEPGDVLVCLRNNYWLDTMNGETGGVRSLVPVPFGPWEGAAMLDMWGDQRRAWIRTDLIDCDGKEWGSFCKTLKKKYRGKGDPTQRWMYVAFGECLTVHKSQGSEWDTVGFHAANLDWFLRKDPEGYKSLVYTAMTRARERLVIFE